jgi:hypothetical protein
VADTQTQSQTLSGTAQGLMSDMERLLGQHLGRLKEQVVSELGKATAAGASVGGGLGMTALGTILGGLAFVHLVHRVTGLPLWLCYAGSSAAACAAGAGLVAEGARKVSQMDLIPDGTGQAARDVATSAARQVAR